MEPDERMNEVEPTIHQLDESIAELRRMAREVDEAGNPNPSKAREDARRWLVSSGFLSYEELAILSQSEALKIIQVRMMDSG